MDLELSETQKILKSAARDFLTKRCPKKLVRELEADDKGYSPQLWQELAELGWMRLAVPSKYSGSDASFLELAVLLEEMGRACFPGPFFSTVLLGCLPILDVGTDEQKQKYLPEIASGEVIFTLALVETSAGYDADAIKMKAIAESNGYVISGTKLFVPYAHIADYMLCVARTADADKEESSKGITIFIVDAKTPGISSIVIDTIARDKLCEVVFDKVKVPRENILGKINEGWDEVQKIIERASIAKCCEMVGGMQAALEMTVEYAKQRVQFGAPIGSFQAIQHHCANMLVDVDTSKVITYEAAWRLTQGLSYAKEAAIAKAWTSNAYKQVVVTGQQVHAGVGIMADHDMSLYFRRAKAAENAFGDSRFHRKAVARHLGFGDILKGK